MAEKDFDLRDMLLEAEADVQEVMRDMLQELEMPLMKEQAIKQWLSQPEAIKEQVKKESPQEYAALMDMIKGE